MKNVCLALKQKCAIEAYLVSKYFKFVMFCVNYKCFTLKNGVPYLCQNFNIQKSTFEFKYFFWRVWRHDLELE